MSDNILDWLKEPEKYYPEPTTILNIIKWHCALGKKYNDLFKKDNKGRAKLGYMSDVQEPFTYWDMERRDEQYLMSLGYDAARKIEAALMLGIEIYFKKKPERSEYEEEFKKYSIRDLDSWAKIFRIPELKDGGDLRQAVEYTASKRHIYLQAYVDAVEAIPSGAYH